jgi:hypothetical protein
LKNCPSDIKQRMADGLCLKMSALSDACGTFDYQAMLESPDPIKYLPLLFSSKFYQSAQLVPAGMEAPTFIGSHVQFWLGLPPFPEASRATVCFMYSTMNSTVYGFYEPTGQDLGRWVECDMFASRPSVCFTVNAAGHVVKYPSNTIISTATAPTGLVVSGDGSAVFMNGAQGWKKHAGDQAWETLGLVGPHLSTSFDGSNLCAHDYAGNATIFCKLGEDDVFETALRQDEFAQRPLHSAVRGSTFFFVRGNRVHTVGYLRAPTIIATLATVGEGPVEGIWADAGPDSQAIWVSGSPASYMSNDGGWTWSRQIDCWAVGAGVFFGEVRGPRPSIQLSSTASFVEDVPYPLVLHNNGGLSSPPAWENWFRLTPEPDDQFTLVRPDVRVATSPNGRFLYTRSPQGEVKLFLNVWNTPNFVKLCETQVEFAHAKRLYCAKFGSIDRQCPQKKSGVPAWVIVLIILAAFALLAYLYFGATKSRHASPLISSKLSSPFQPVPNSSSPLYSRARQESFSPPSPMQ